MNKWSGTMVVGALALHSLRAFPGSLQHWVETEHGTSLSEWQLRRPF